MQPRRQTRASLKGLDEKSQHSCSVTNYNSIPFVSLTPWKIVPVAVQQNEEDEHIADAGQQNGSENEGGKDSEAELNHDGHTPNEANMNEVNDNEQA
jgi:hypothetical protein